MAENQKEKKTQNIADLDKVSVDITCREETFTKQDGDEFTINVAEIDGQDYRVPASVLKQLKAVLKEIPDLKYFKVSKSGEGMNTEYTVIPLKE